MSGVSTTGMRVIETAPSTMNDANTIRIVTGCSIENFASLKPKP
jgi:hypothetical protein